jgi:nucleotide-binding universal stress UspA family protein
VNTNIRSILVGDDATEEASRAVEVASTLAQCCSARLILVSVVEESAEQQAEGYGPKSSEHDVLKELKQASSKLKETGVHVKTKLLRGDAEKALAELAEAESCDLIVIGHRNISRVRRWLEGSTSSGLLRDTGISLLIVR